jgi:hypothetical protein
MPDPYILCDLAPSVLNRNKPFVDWEADISGISRRIWSIFPSFHFRSRVSYLLARILLPKGNLDREFGLLCDWRFDPNNPTSTEISL